MRDNDKSGGYSKSSVAIFAIATIVILALMYISFRSNLLTNAFDISRGESEPSEATVNAIFGTIQFAVASVSGMIILFGLIISASLGRSVSEARHAARRELEDLAKLYKESIEYQTRTVEIQVKGAVDSYISHFDVVRLLDEIKESIEKSELERKKIEPIVSDYIKFQMALQDLEDDYVGPFDILLKDRENSGDKPAFDSENRVKWRNALLLLEDGAARRKVTANDAFNGAQTASTLGFSELSHRLAVWGNWLQPCPLYAARVFRSEYERGERLSVSVANQPGVFELIRDQEDINDPLSGQRIRDEAYNNVFNLLDDVPLFNCHLTYSEVWNIAVRSETMDEFIKRASGVCARSEAAGRYVPSFLYASLARAHCIAGGPSWRDEGQEAFKKALALIQRESPKFTWHAHSVQELEHAMIVAPDLDDYDPTDVELERNIDDDQTSL